MVTVPKSMRTPAATILASSGNAGIFAGTIKRVWPAAPIPAIRNTQIAAWDFGCRARMVERMKIRAHQPIKPRKAEEPSINAAGSSIGFTEKKVTAKTPKTAVTTMPSNPRETRVTVLSTTVAAILNKGSNT